MAKVLDEFPQSGNAIHSWDLWLDGRIWELNKSTDFPNSLMNSFRSQIYQAAKERGLKVKMNIKKGSQTIVIQAYNPNQVGKYTTTSISPLLKETRKDS